MTVSIAFMSGRLGAVLGNLIFPYLLTSGCLPPFLTIGTLTIGKFYLIEKRIVLIILFPKGCTLLALLLPNTDNKALE